MKTVIDLDGHGGNIYVAHAHLCELVAHLLDEVKALHKANVIPASFTALTEQMQALTKRVNEIPAPVVAKPPPPPPVNVTHVAPAHEMRLHFKGETTVQITSQTPDGVRLVKFLLE